MKDTFTKNYLQNALDMGYALDDLVPLIPVGATLRGAFTTQDGETVDALELEPGEFGKTPGRYNQHRGHWSRRLLWNSTSIDMQEVEIHDAAGGNLGLKQGLRLASLDVDIKDASVMQLVRHALHQAGVTGPIRTGQAPKALWMFRVQGEPVRRAQVPLVGGHLIEVIGMTRTGNPAQSVAAGGHPSGVEYTWDTGTLPPFQSLPMIDQAGMDRLVGIVEQAALAGGLERAKFEHEGGEGCGETSRMGLTAEPEIVARVMDLLPIPQSKNWKLWKDTGIALFNAVGPEIGEEIYHKWSKRSAAYDAQDTDKTWRRGMWPNNRKSGFGSLVYRARQAVGGRLSLDIEAMLVQRKFNDAGQQQPIPGVEQAMQPIPGVEQAMQPIPGVEQSAHDLKQLVTTLLMGLVTAGPLETRLGLDEIKGNTGIDMPTLKAELKRLRGQINAAQNTGEFLNIEAMQTWFTGCVYVIGINRIFTLEQGLLDRDQFNVVFGGRTFQMGSDSNHNTTDAWKAFTQNRVVRFGQAEGVMFRPEHTYGEVVTAPDGKRNVNTLRIPMIESNNDPVDMFTHHLALLLPDEGDRRILLAWMSAVIQNPGRKVMWSPVLQGVEGNGKSYIMKAMEYCIGQSLTHWVNPEDMNEKYNGYLAENLLICVEEIHMADRREILDRLKKYITSERIEIRNMNQNKTTMDSLVVFMFCTNWQDAILKSINDRRFAVFFTAQQRVEDLAEAGMDAQYFNNLWQWSYSGGFAAILGFLRSYQIADADHPLVGATRAPRTSSNDRAVQASMGTYETTITELIEEGHVGFRNGWINLDVLRPALEEQFGRKPNDKAIWSALQNLGYNKIEPRVRLGTGRKLTRLYSKDNYTGSDQIIAAYNNTQMPSFNSSVPTAPLGDAGAAVVLQDGP